MAVTTFHGVKPYYRRTWRGNTTVYLRGPGGKVGSVTFDSRELADKTFPAHPSKTYTIEQEDMG